MNPKYLTPEAHRWDWLIHNLWARLYADTPGGCEFAAEVLDVWFTVQGYDGRLNLNNTREVEIEYARDAFGEVEE